MNLLLHSLPLAAAVDENDLVRLVVSVCVVGLLCWLLLWLVGYIGIPEPFAKVIKAIIAVVAVIFLIHVIYQLPGLV